MNKLELASSIVKRADLLGWSITVQSDMFVMYRVIGPHNHDAFCRAHIEYYSILSLLPTTGPARIWGTNGSGPAAYSAIESGVFTMFKSGVDAEVLAAIQDILEI